MKGVCVCVDSGYIQENITRMLVKEANILLLGKAPESSRGDSGTNCLGEGAV